MELVLSNNFCEMSFADCLNIEGGAWSWADFGKSILGGAAGGAAGGAIVGACAGGVGAAPGAGLGALGGAVAGAATYAVVGWW